MNLNLKEFQESNKYIKSHQENKNEFLDEFLIQIEITFEFEHQLDFQENS